MHLDRIDLVFWAAGLLGHVILLLVLLRRQLANNFPFFTALIAGNVARTAILYVAFHYATAQTYSFTYWSMALVDVFLQLCVVYELATHVFRPLGKWAQDIRRSLQGILCGSVAVAGGLSWLAAPVTSTWQEMLVVKGSFFSSVLMSELFVCMTALSISVGLPWRTHVARISQGFGTYSIVDIVIEAGHTVYGVAYSARVDGALSEMRIATYLVCVTYWIATLAKGAPASRELPDSMRQQLFTFQEYVAANLHSVRSWRKQ